MTLDVDGPEVIRRVPEQMEDVETVIQKNGGRRVFGGEKPGGGIESVLGSKGDPEITGESFPTEEMARTVATPDLSATASRNQRSTAETWLRNMASSPATGR